MVSEEKDKGGRPKKPCEVCGGEREGDLRVQVGGKKVPVCKDCARETREWKGPGLKPDARRGRKRAPRAGFRLNSVREDETETR